MASSTQEVGLVLMNGKFTRKEAGHMLMKGKFVTWRGVEGFIL